MSGPSVKTIKKLFALSGNICGLPGCSNPMIDSDGIVAGEICHIKAVSAGGPRYDALQSDKNRHSFENLILLCSVDHKKVDERLDLYTADLLTQMKATHEQAAGRREFDSDEAPAKKLLASWRLISLSNVSGNIAIGSPGAVQGHTIHIKAAKQKFSVNAPPGTIGADQSLTRYVSHLITRYNEFARCGQTGFRHAVISVNVERRFGAKWQFLPIEKAEAVIEYLQGRINKTQLAKLQRSKGQPAFSSYREFMSKHGFQAES